MNKKRAYAFILASSLLISLPACESPALSQREKGALLGGTMGAGLGAIVGHATGETGAGIAIGAAAGAIGGGLIGNESDRIEGRQTEQDERMRRQDEMIRQQQREIDELRRSRGDGSSRQRDPYPSDYDRRDDYRY